MPRIARKDSKSNFYHIIVQGINQEYIFKKEEYIKNYKELIKKKLKENKVTILAYCIMSNHAHFLIFSEKVEYLSKYMQNLNTSYSQYYNKRNKRVGYVFRNRYYSQEILTNQQLYTCLRYIHNNPVKANISKKMEDYRYSSYNEYLGKKDIISNEAIKLIFGKDYDYEKEFLYVHKIDSEEEFLEVKDKEINALIFEIEEMHGETINNIIKDKDKLKNVIQEARKQTDVTIVELSQILDLSKSTIGRYAKINKDTNKKIKFEKREKRTVPISQTNH